MALSPLNENFIHYNRYHSGKVKFLDNLLFVDCIIGIFIIFPDGNCLKMFVSVDTSFVSPK